MQATVAPTNLKRTLNDASAAAAAAAAAASATTSSAKNGGERKNTEEKEEEKKKHPAAHLVAGGAAGLVESSVCHPLDTVKTRMMLQRGSGRQKWPSSSAAAAACARAHADDVLGNAPQQVRNESGRTCTTSRCRRSGGANTRSRSRAFGTASADAAATVRMPTASAAASANAGAMDTARRIIRKEGLGSLYRGLSAVYTGIVPKMAIRFLSFEQYREGLQTMFYGGPQQPPGTPPGQFAPTVTFFAGLASGLTEAILVVTPAEVCKIRMQSQYNSMVDPSQLRHRKYTNVAQTAVTIVREEGLGALYKGVVPTMLRQGCNQAVNFTTYNYFKKTVIEWRRERGQSAELLHWQSLILGGISGGFGPMVNNPLDVVKTRMQKQVVHPGREPKYTGLLQSCMVIAKEEGYPALWKGIAPRLMRIVPGQAITFMTYEFVSKQLNGLGLFVFDADEA